MGCRLGGAKSSRKMNHSHNFFFFIGISLRQGPLDPS